MVFKEAYEALKQGAMIKLPEWVGYWKWEDNSIKMYCKDGRVLDICVDYTLKFIMRDDWEIVCEADVKCLNIQTFTFGETIRNLKAGKKVARKGWNGEGTFLFLSDEIHFLTKANLNKQDGESYDVCPSIIMKTADNKCVVGWLASQTDMLATDWVIVE